MQNQIKDQIGDLKSWLKPEQYPEAGKLYGVLAEYNSPGALVEAAKKVRDAGIKEFDCYSPFPVHGIDDAMGIKRTILPALVFGGGFVGLVGGLLLQWYCNAFDWRWIISGKPFFSLPANIAIGFETTILLSVFTTFFGMWTLNKLPKVWHPFFRLDRFAKVSDDGFMLGIEAKDARFNLEETTKLLKAAGAIEVEPAYMDPDRAARVMPKWIFGLIAVTTVMALIPFAVVAKARASKSKDPHYHIFGDMDFQPKRNSDTSSTLFDDGRTNRGAIAGTVARGSLNEADDFYRGIDSSGAEPNWLTGLPADFVANEKAMARGQLQYDIFCAPCHGLDGRGKGPVKARSLAIGQAFNVADLISPGGNPYLMPNGQLFNVISNGSNSMLGYASQMNHYDRWATVLYVRALQRGQNAQAADL